MNIESSFGGATGRKTTKAMKKMMMIITMIMIFSPCLINDSIPSIQGAALAQWIRCCATNKEVAGSIPDGVNGIFY